MVETEYILEKLRAYGIKSEAISILTPDQTRTDADQKFIPEKQSNIAEGVAAGAGTGGVFGGILGWLVGIGSLAIPGLGPFIAAGPLMSVLGGTALGAAVGGFAGIFAGLGLPEYEAKIYERKLHEGWTLVSVQTAEEEGEKREHIKEIFAKAGATNISDINFNSLKEGNAEVLAGDLYARQEALERGGKQGTKSL